MGCLPETKLPLASLYPVPTETLPSEFITVAGTEVFPGLAAFAAGTIAGLLAIAAGFSEVGSTFECPANGSAVTKFATIVFTLSALPVRLPPVVIAVSPFRPA